MNLSLSALLRKVFSALHLYKPIRNLYHRIRKRLLKLYNAVRCTHTIHCLGDSHLGSFEHVASNKQLKRTRFKFCRVDGATASGLANPNSQTQAGPIFHKYLGRIQSTDTLLLCLGEVDCAFVIWYRAVKYGVPISDQFELTLQNYFQFLDDLQRRGFNQIIIYSAPLPTIQDGQTWGDIAQLRKEVKASLRERTDLTLQFNHRLRTYCAQNDLLFMDLEAETLDTDTMLIQDRFRHLDPLDHHHNPYETAGLIVNHLRAMGYS